MRGLAIKYFPYCLSAFFIALGISSVGIARCTSGFVIAWMIPFLVNNLVEVKRALEFLDSDPIHKSLLGLLKVLFVTTLTSATYKPLSHLYIQPRILSVAIALGVTTAIIYVSHVAATSVWRWLEPLLNRWLDQLEYGHVTHSCQSLQIPQMCQQCQNCSPNAFLFCAINPDGPVNDFCQSFESLRK